MGSLINGKRYDFSSLELAFIGAGFLTQPVIGFKEITYSSALEPGMVYGAHAQPIGRTRGQYKPEAALTLYRQEFDELITTLGAQAQGRGFMEVEFNILLSYSDDGQPLVSDIIETCRIKKVDHSASGTDALEVKLELSPMNILHNDKSAVSGPLPLPSNFFAS